MLVTMKNRQRRLGVFLCVIILISLNDFCVGAKADLTEIVDTSDRAEKLKAEGKYIEATRLAERALEMAQAQLDEKTVAFPVFLHRLAGLYREDGRYEEAAELYTRAIKLRGEVDRKRLPNTINDFALLNWDEAKYAEAEQLFMQAKTLYTEQSGPTSEDVATCDTNLGLLYRDMARYDAAEKLMQEGRVIREAQNTGTRDLDIANSLHNIASLDRDQGRFSEAEPLARRGLEIRRAKLGTEHPELAKSMNVLAEILRATGRYDEAIQLLNSAVAIRKRAFGDDHPAVATSLNSLGAVYESQGRLSDAETSYKAALTIREHRLKPLFPGHPDLATSQANLGALYKAQHRYEQAEPLLRSALEIREKTLGKEHPDYLKSLYELGELMKLRGKSGEADEYFDRVLSIRKTAVHQVNIFFATDRKVDAAAKSLAFGSERSNALTFGTANIWVPTELSRAQTPLAASRPLERMSRISQDETTEVARLVIRSKLHVPDTEITDWATAKLGDAQRFRGQALVFVHGFNVSFDNALKRAAQIAYDVGFDGAVFVFSWPSRGGDSLISNVLRIWDYRYDRVSAEIAGAHLQKFLERIASHTAMTKLHLIAHSMGNKALLEALRLSANAGKMAQLRTGEIILAAPDVERDSFAQLIGSLEDIGSKLTLYASSNDKVLLASRWFWQGAPAGYVASGKDPMLIDHVETINITAAGDSSLGLNHDVYARNPDISKDMRLLLEGGKHPPGVRSANFIPQSAREGVYWLYRRNKP